LANTLTELFLDIKSGVAGRQVVIDEPKQEDLHSRLGVLDTEFSARALPMRYRPLESFKDIYGTLPDGPERTSRFDAISRWFEGRYGQDAHWDGIIGRIPVLWRGGVYLVLVPFAGSGKVVTLRDQIEAPTCGRDHKLSEPL
jgi:hypothetical protein